MKSIRFALLALVGTSCFSIHAAGNELLTEEVSQKKYERKVLLQLADMGIKNREAGFLVFFCVEEKAKSAEKKLVNEVLGNLSGNCLPIGKWNFSISQSLENRAAKALLNRVSGNRYDALTILPNKLSLKTLNETIEADSLIKGFSFDTGSFSTFKISVDNYLNTNVSPLMIDLLAKAKDARYQEMQDKERETFLATVAKEVSVPVGFIEKLMNSAFVFALHTETPTGSVTISQSTRKRLLQFETKVSVNLSSNLAIFRFNADSGKFDFYKRISERSGKVSASSKIYPIRPTTAGAILEPFDNSYIVAAKAAGIASNIRLKADDNFAIFSTIDDLNGNEFSSMVGENEDLRVDAPYKIYQYIDDKKTETGWGKARSVASKTTFIDDNSAYKSDFDLISGDMEIKDQLREHPWSGVFAYLDAGTMTVNVDSVNNQNYTGGGSFSGIHLGIKTDLGYMFNSEMFAGIGGGGEDIALAGNAARWTDPSVVTAGLDLSFRHHLGSSSLYASYKLGLGAAQIDASGVALDDDLVLRTGLSLDWGLQLGYLSSPDREFFINVQGLVPLGGEAKSNDVALDAELSGGVEVNIGCTMHMKAIGGLARLMN